VGQVHALAEQLARLGPLVPSPKRSTEFDQRLGMLEAGRRRGKGVDRFAQELLTFRSTLD
jgi:hypothetical protein